MVDQMGFSTIARFSYFFVYAACAINPTNLLQIEQQYSIIPNTDKTDLIGEIIFSISQLNKINGTAHECYMCDETDTLAVRSESVQFIIYKLEEDYDETGDTHRFGRDLNLYDTITVISGVCPIRRVLILMDNMIHIYELNDMLSETTFIELISLAVYLRRLENIIEFFN